MVETLDEITREETGFVRQNGKKKNWQGKEGSDLRNSAAEWMDTRYEYP